ncbi:hypothetical protein KIN20_033601 [Parelaphostrongylus tenuis]|uniref:Uncharacterized protein n=1 Tax=Parelaphostrongylus tenuis TaxID=148309 RepID=A0AAD5WIZ8_PARTN|nr:hypothetical protein KIN20_033601 [Parelaphostrongylus tenuis]
MWCIIMPSRPQQFTENSFAAMLPSPTAICPLLRVRWEEYKTKLTKYGAFSDIINEDYAVTCALVAS